MKSELVMSTSAIVISLIAALYTVRAFILKAGLNIRGSFSVTSSVACEDQYISDVTLHNLKDRAVAIFKIFVELDHGYYVELDDFESDPLILRPFEVWHRDYQPIEMYSVSLRRIKFDQMLSQDRVRRRLVLSVAEGKYVVHGWIRRWDPVVDFFNNHATVVAACRRSTFEGKSYGSNARYVVDITLSDGRRELVPVYAADASIRKFRAFTLTPESLRSKRALEEFLLQQAVAGLLPCSDLKVHDLESWRAGIYDERKKPVLTAKPRSWFQYQVLGRLATHVEDRRLRRENRARHAEALARSKAEQQEPSTPEANR